MKKGLLLSVVASTMIFAGGDIAPVEPAAPASADFWGQIGMSYQADDFGKYNFSDTENNAFSTAIVLGVEKELGNGFGFGAEVAGWSDFGLDIADNPRVVTTDATSAEVSQAYLTYTFGNTAIKAGRQALPKAVSPWAWTDRTVGVVDIAYDGIVIANTDLQDTTLVGAWIKHAQIDSNAEASVGDNGLFMLAAINKSLANTTLSVSAYYVPDNNLDWHAWNVLRNVAQTPKDNWSIWASAESQFDGFNGGVQFAYVDGDYKSAGNPNSSADATYAVAAKIGGNWGDLGLTLIAGYINDGEYSLTTAGAFHTIEDTSAFWGNSLGGFFGGNIVGDNQTIVRGVATYKLPYGKLMGELAYDNAGSDGLFNSVWGARAKYSFPIAGGVNGSVEYRYAKYDDLVTDFKTGKTSDETRQRIRVEAYYKF
jgi:hypothetical protein